MRTNTGMSTSERRDAPRQLQNLGSVARRRHLASLKMQAPVTRQRGGYAAAAAGRDSDGRLAGVTKGVFVPRRRGFGRDDTVQKGIGGSGLRRGGFGTDRNRGRGEDGDGDIETVKKKWNRASDGRANTINGRERRTTRRRSPWVDKRSFLQTGDGPQHASSPTRFRPIGSTSPSNRSRPDNQYSSRPRPKYRSRNDDPEPNDHTGKTPEKTARELQTELRYLGDPVKLADHALTLLRADKASKVLELLRQAGPHHGTTVSWNHLIDYHLSQGKVAPALKCYNEVRSR